MSETTWAYFIMTLLLFLASIVAFSRGYEVGAEAVARVICEQQGLEWIDEESDTPVYGTWQEPDVTCIRPIERVAP